MKLVLVRVSQDIIRIQIKNAIHAHMIVLNAKKEGTAFLVMKLLISEFLIQLLQGAFLFLDISIMVQQLA